uniref:Uncharacterized protein n=1 Tax=Solanum lycopersicum TaxID=4081 RepID=A0A3Q7IFP2_SOLLC
MNNCYSNLGQLSIILSFIIFQFQVGSWCFNGSSVCRSSTILMDPLKLYDPIVGEHFNIFAASPKITDRVVTVNHGYSWKQTSKGRRRFHQIINENDWKLQDIVNRIDTKESGTLSGTFTYSVICLPELLLRHTADCHASI